MAGGHPGSLPNGTMDKSGPAVPRKLQRLLGGVLLAPPFTRVKTAMQEQRMPGQVVILNGAPRAGKSSIVTVIQDTFEGVWMNLGVDVFARGVTPKRYQPGIGLRPGPGPGFGGDLPDLEPFVPTFYAAAYESIAAHSRLGLNVISEFGHHSAIHPGVLGDCARRLAGLAVLFVGVRCPLDVIMTRRNESGGPDGPVPTPVLLWREEVHKPGIYDLEVDTSLLSPRDCAEVIRRRLAEGPPGTAFQKLAGRP
jgi:chloramphenicol 3-O phosphotransferase